MIRLLVALGGGAVAWSLHLVLSYAVIGLACRPEGPLLDPGDGLVVAILWAISALAVLGAAASALVALVLCRRHPSADDPVGQRGERALAFVGLLLDVVFGVTIVIGASAIAVLPLC